MNAHDIEGRIVQFFHDDGHPAGGLLLPTRPLAIEQFELPYAGPVLRRLREANGKSAKEVANAIKMNESMLSRYETEKTAVKLSVAARIAAGIGIKEKEVIELCLAQIMRDFCERYGSERAGDVAGIISRLLESCEGES